MNNKMSFGDHLFRTKDFAWFWLLVRLYVGFAWIEAGLGKLTNPAWVGEGAGNAVRGFIGGALKKTGGDRPDVAGWYAWFLENVALPNAQGYSYAVALGETLVGLALIIGAIVGVAAMFGVIMNMSFLLAGTVSSNPVLLVLGIALMLAWRFAGYYGVDRFIFKKQKHLIPSA